MLVKVGIQTDETTCLLRLAQGTTRFSPRRPSETNAREKPCPLMNAIRSASFDAAVAERNTLKTPLSSAEARYESTDRSRA